MAEDATRPAANDNLDSCERDEPMVEVTRLDFAAQFVIWGVRAWVQAFKTEEAFAAVTGQTFTRFNMQPAALAIDGIMRVLAASALRPIDIRCTQCRYLSPDEAILLDAIAAGQGERYFVATVALRKVMPGTAARLALPHVFDLARALAAAKMTLRPPAPSSADRPALTPSRTLH